MAPYCTRRRLSSAHWIATVLASAATACGTLSGPLDIEMWTSERPSAYAKPDYSGTVDFQRGLFFADIFGAHYVGELLPLGAGRFKIQARTKDGLTMTCDLGQLQPELWRGSCVDPGNQVIEMRVGRYFHV